MECEVELRAIVLIAALSGVFTLAGWIAGSIVSGLWTQPQDDEHQ